MSLTMKWRIMALTMSAAVWLSACNNDDKAGKEAVKDTTATATKTETPKAPAGPTLPFNAVVIRHGVADYAKWRPLFDSDSTARNAAGMHLFTVARGIDDPNMIDIPFMIDDVAKAKAFAADPRLRDVMKKGGVTGAPKVNFINVIRMSEAASKPGEFIEVIHKVKDYDAWLKAFDGEGTAKRQNDGLTDGVLARGIDDPNLVYLVFVITDMNKAKAALNDPVRMKLMKDAGVIGKPDVYFGKDVQ